MLYWKCFKTIFLGFTRQKDLKVEDKLVGLTNVRLVNRLFSVKERPLPWGFLWELPGPSHPLEANGGLKRSLN